MPSALIIGGTTQDRLDRASSLAAEDGAVVNVVSSDDAAALSSFPDQEWIVVADAHASPLPMQTALLEEARERTGFVLLGFKTDPMELVEHGKFREDLYWRAASTTIRIEQGAERQVQVPLFAGFEAATEERPAPRESRAAPDSWSHVILLQETDEPVLRFWFPEAGGELCPVDFEVLDPRFDELDLVRDMILRLFFIELTDHYYADKIETISLARLGSENAINIPYPR